GIINRNFISIGQNYSHRQLDSYPKAINNIQCLICTETFDRQYFEPVTSKCTHENNVCINCVRMHIKVEVENKGNVTIKCPFSGQGCPGILEEVDVKYLANKDDFERHVVFNHSLCILDLDHLFIINHSLT